MGLCRMERVLGGGGMVYWHGRVLGERESMYGVWCMVEGKLEGCLCLAMYAGNMYVCTLYI